MKDAQDVIDDASEYREVARRAKELGIIEEEHVKTGATLASGTTVGGNIVYHSGNDGSGSGLDADTVDGVEAADLGVNFNVTNRYKITSPDGGEHTNNYQAVLFPVFGGTWYSKENSGGRKFKLNGDVAPQVFDGTDFKFTLDYVTDGLSSGANSGYDVNVEVQARNTSGGLENVGFINYDTSESYTSSLTLSNAGNVSPSTFRDLRLAISDFQANGTGDFVEFDVTIETV